VGATFWEVRGRVGVTGIVAVCCEEEFELFEGAVFCPWVPPEHAGVYRGVEDARWGRRVCPGSFEGGVEREMELET